MLFPIIDWSLLFQGVLIGASVLAGLRGCKGIRVEAEQQVRMDRNGGQKRGGQRHGEPSWRLVEFATVGITLLVLHKDDRARWKNLITTKSTP
ncbi:hypothetical protein N9B73_12335 [Verrucomicrobiales bacterium]|nr:hypothetical protein [Verrucomicrobiales bacterium]